MARTKKAANGHADDETTTNTGAADDLAECYVEYVEMMGQISRVRQKIAAMLQRYDGMGVNVKAIKACYRLANMDDAPDYVKELLKSAAILKIIPAEEESDGQMTFLPGLKVAPPSQAKQDKVNRSKVFWDGYDAGLAGHLIEVCTFQAGSEDFMTWRDGWDDGHRDFEAKPKKERKPTSREKRVNDRAATQPPETQLERDEASYRGLDADVSKALADVGAEMPADPV